MPYLVSKVLVTEAVPVNLAESGAETIGQLVDQALADMIGAAPPNSVPQSIEFGFDGETDFHAFMRNYDPFRFDKNPHGKRRKSINRGYGDEAVSE